MEKTIIVNTHKINKDEMSITYEEVCDLALGDKYNARNVYTVNYAKGVNDKSGSLIKRQEVEIIDGMIFNVSLTNNA